MNVISDSEYLGSNEGMNKIREEFDTFPVEDFPMYCAGAASLVLPATFWRTNPMEEEGYLKATYLVTEPLNQMLKDVKPK